MANLRNAAVRARINEAFADCRACTKDQCPEYCDEMVQCQLDEIIDDLMAPPITCGKCNSKNTNEDGELYCIFLGRPVKPENHCCWGWKGDAS